MTSIKPRDDVSPLVDTYRTVMAFRGSFLAVAVPFGEGSHRGCARTKLHGRAVANLLIRLMFRAGLTSRSSGAITVVAGAPRHKDARRQIEEVAVSLRLTREVVERFKAGGPGWQTRMDEALKKAVGL
jgi:hypothetical protein